MIFLVPLASAGLLDTLSPGERQVAICQDAAAPAAAAFDYPRAAGVWEACVAECKRIGATDVVPMLEDQLALTRAMADAAEWRTSDPNRYALAVLAVAAGQRSTTWPGTDIADLFRAWMATEAGKGRLAKVRTVTVEWQGVVPGQEELARHASEVLRRYVEDLGLKWADPGKPEVNVIVFATLSVSDAVPVSTSRAGSVPRAQARIAADHVRFRTIDDTVDGFSASATAEDPVADAAREEALRAACERAAARLLKQVLQVVFP